MEKTTLTTAETGLVHGAVAPGFEGVADAFEANFTTRGDLGAAFAAYRDGEPLVDLWGGIADRTSGRPWQVDTMQVIFSGTKGVVGICLLMLVERGALELDVPVERYWPEFGKPQIRVRELVSHTARLPGIDAPITLKDFFDDRRMASLLAEQAVSEDPRAAFTYHAMTFGWLCGELVRRVDGRSVGTFLAEEVSGPLGLDLWLGLPEAEEQRVATLELAATWPTNRVLDPGLHERDRHMWSMFGNPPVMLRSGFAWNMRACHAAEIAAAGAIGTARSVAQLYAGLDRLLRPETLALGRTTLSEGRCGTLEQPLRFGVGIQLSTDAEPFGPVPDAFGHPGAGGSVHGCWPQQRIGFSYAMNLMRDDENTDSRAAAVLAALYDAATRTECG